jgi:hypothetical protein
MGKLTGNKGLKNSRKSSNTSILEVRRILVIGISTGV